MVVPVLSPAREEPPSAYCPCQNLIDWWEGHVEGCPRRRLVEAALREAAEQGWTTRGPGIWVRT